MNVIRKIAAGIAAVALLTGIGATQASAQDADSARAAAVVQPSANTVTTTTIKDGQVFGWDVADNTLPWGKLGSQLRGEIRAGQTKADAASAKAAEALTKANQALAKPDAGATEFTKVFDPKLIEFIGGGYFEAGRGFTKIGELTLQPGTWNLSTNVTFSRTVAGDEGVRPQVGVRVGQDASATGDARWGTELGTVGGNDISKVKNKQLWGSTSGSIKVTSPTTVGIYGHGFTDTEGTADNQISAAVTVKITQG